MDCSAHLEDEANQGKCIETVFAYRTGTFSKSRFESEEDQKDTRKFEPTPKVRFGFGRLIYNFFRTAFQKYPRFMEED